MSRATLAVVCDQLRALGLEDVARWVEHPDAVRELLKRGELAHVGDTHAGDWYCNGCGAPTDDAHQSVEVNVFGRTPGEREHCPIAAAWRALGDPRGQADIERAHEEALNQDRARANRGGIWDLSPEQGFTYSAPASAMAAFNDAREQRWVTLHRTMAGRLEQISQLVAEGLITQGQVQQILDYPLGVAGGIVTK